MGQLKKIYSRDVEREVELIKRRLFKLHLRLAAHGDYAIVSFPAVSNVCVDSERGQMTVSFRVGTPAENTRVKN